MSSCKVCGWPRDEHEFDTLRCPDYSTSDGVEGWFNTTYMGDADEG